MQKDPVCGMSVDAATAKYRCAHGGEEYVFCGAYCSKEFQREPAQYLAPEYRPSMLRLLVKFVGDRLRSLIPGARHSASSETDSRTL